MGLSRSNTMMDIPGTTQTGEPIKVKPKKLPFFKCSRELKEKVDTPK